MIGASMPSTSHTGVRNTALLPDPFRHRRAISFYVKA
jgi:hypothetical protein